MYQDRAGYKRHDNITPRYIHFNLPSSILDIIICLLNRREDQIDLTYYCLLDFNRVRMMIANYFTHFVF